MRDFLSDRLNDGEGVSTRAARIGIDHRTYAKVEADPATIPAAAVARKVADFYGTRVTDLWSVQPVVAPAEAA